MATLAAILLLSLSPGTGFVMGDPGGTLANAPSPPEPMRIHRPDQSDQALANSRRGRVRKFREPFGELLKLPSPRKICGLRPRGCLVSEVRQGSLSVHGRKGSKQAQLLGEGRKPAGLQGGFERAEL